MVHLGDLNADQCVTIMTGISLFAVGRDVVVDLGLIAYRRIVRTI